MLFGQLAPGSYGAAGDSYGDRLRYMDACLDSLSKVRPRLRSIAFPHNMGCGIASGAWNDYLTLPCAWARKNSDIHVHVVRWDREAYSRDLSKLKRISRDLTGQVSGHAYG